MGRGEEEEAVDGGAEEEEEEEEGMGVAVLVGLGMDEDGVVDWEEGLSFMDDVDEDEALGDNVAMASCGSQTKPGGRDQPLR